MPGDRPAALLLDTRLLHWAAFEPDRLAPAARLILQSRESPLLFSLATVWEVAIKTSLGRADFSVDPGLLHRALLAEGFVELPISASQLVRVGTLTWVHGDPLIDCWWRRPLRRV